MSWTNAAGDTAVFAGASGTVPISGAVSALAVDFRGSGTVVTGGSFLTNAMGTTFTATATAQFNAPISGFGGITKAGPGTLTLGAPVSTYTGDTIVSAGLLNVFGTIHSHVRIQGVAVGVGGVMFRDPDLARAVREALGVDPNAWLTATLLAQSPPIESLTVDANVVSELTGIGTFLTGLKSLEVVPFDHSLPQQGLTNHLWGLSGLQNLTTLRLNYVGLTNTSLASLASITSIPSLARLDVRDNLLSEIPDGILARHPKIGSVLVHDNSELIADKVWGLRFLKGKAVDVDLAPNRPETATSIAGLAERLYYLPLKMLEYVTNTIVYQPYAGAMKGALATLQTRTGNDWDTNSLLAALFTEAQVSTRYIYGGKALVTEDQLKDYTGNRSAAAADVLIKAGQSVTLYPELGLYAIDHSWIEADLFVPATGSPAWVPIDASWKFRDFRPGLASVLSNVPFAAHQESDYLTNPAWQKKSAAEYYESKVAAWLATNHPGLTIADVGYDGSIIQQSFQSLPTGLPYVLIGTTTTSTTIPASARYTIGVTLKSGATTLFTTTLPLDQDSLSRIVLDPTINLSGAAQPRLFVNGLVRATASSQVSNADTANVTLRFDVTAATGGTSYSREFTRKANQMIAVGLDANQFSEGLLAQKRAVANAQQLNRANGLTVNNEQAVGGLLDLAIASYFTAANADEASIAALTSAIPGRSNVGLGIATSDAMFPLVPTIPGYSSSGPTVNSTPVGQLQFPYLPAGIGLDIPANFFDGFAIDSTTPAIDLERYRLLGYANSSLEGLLIEELTNFESVSTIKALQLAATAAGGLSNLEEITTANVGQITTKLQPLNSTQEGQQIVQAIASIVTNGISGAAEYAGVKFKAVVPKDMVSVGVGAQAWTGVGYTLTVDAPNASDPGHALHGKTLYHIIHGSVVGGPLLSYGGASSFTKAPTASAYSSLAASVFDNSAGDPVNIANGNVYHEETDVTIPNVGTPLAFDRRYDSIHTVSGLAGTPAVWSDRGMGEGWSFSYSDRLEIATNGDVTWFTDTGTRLGFTKAGSLYTNPAGVFGTLSGSAATGFTWKDHDGNTTSFGVAVAGTTSYLGEKRDRFGNGIKVLYVSGTTKISRVEDLRNSSRALTFTYNALSQPQITQVADFTGRTWTYSYASGRLATATAPAPAVGGLAPVVRYAYHSDAARRGLLASVTDPAGGVTSWDYYVNRRGFRVTDSEGLQHSFTYNLHRRRSAFINERGLATRYDLDDAGNQIAVQQPDRATERSTWSANGLKLSATDAYGQTDTYAYDILTGKLTSHTDATLRLTEFAYSFTTASAADLVSITRRNAAGNPSDDVVTRFEYDSTGFLEKRTDDEGTGKLNLATRFTKAPGGRGLVESSRTPRGVTTSYGYNTAGQVTSHNTNTSFQSPSPAVAELFGFDNRGNLISTTDENNNVTTFTYDALGRKTSEQSADPDGAGPLPSLVSAYAYDVLGNVISTTSPGSRVTAMAYDSRQREIQRTAPDGTTTRMTYDPMGNVATATDALGRVTRYVYDANSRLVATVHPDGTTTRMRVDSGGRVVGAVDQSGAVTTFSYDTLGRKVRETLPDPDGSGPLAAPSSAWGYDSRGNLAFVTPNFVGQAGVTAGMASRSTRYEYDAAGRITKETAADPDGLGPRTGPETTYTYDADGNVIAMTDPRGSATTYTYDIFGRLATETTADPDGTGPLVPLVSWYQYDLSGNLVKQIAPGAVTSEQVGFNTDYVYDALNRRIMTTLPDPDGSANPLSRPISTQAYDGWGRLAQSTDALGRTTTYEYDTLGRSTAVTDPLGARTQSVFDAAGNIVVTIDALGRRTFITYDSMNRQVAVRAPRADSTSPAPVSTLTYDAKGQVVASTDANGHTTWRQHDALGRVTGTTDALGISSGDPQHTVRTEYDSAGQVIATTDQLGRRSDTVYDNLGRMIRTLAPDAGQGRPITEYGYDAAGNLRFTTDPRVFNVVDGDFELPTLADGTFQGGATGSAWAFTSGSGVASNGSGFTASNPPSPSGRQVAYMQGNATVTQTVQGWGAGTYVISFRAAQRANGTGGQNTFQVRIDGQVLATFLPNSTAYESITTPAFTVTAGAHTIRFEGTDVMTGKTVFIDDVQILKAPVSVADGSFELPVLSAGTSEYAPPGGPWTFAGGASGLASNGSDFTGNLPSGNPPAPTGTQVLYIQNTGTATQTVGGWQAGSYVVSLKAARRANAGGNNDFRVLIDGQPVATFLPSSTAYEPFTTIPFTVSAGQHSITLEGLNTAGGNNTVFIDDVQFLPAPAPTPVAAPVADANFEQPALPANAFQYYPAGSAWTFAGAASGIATNDSGFTSGNPAAPSARQVMFIQGTGTVTQNVQGWLAGSYVVSGRAARRASDAGVNSIRVLIDGQQVGMFSPTSSAYGLLATNAFTVPAGAHTIRFEGTDTGDGNTSFIDDIQILPSPIADNSFEQPALNAGDFQYAPTGSPWTFAGGASGIASNGSAFTGGNPPAPTGTQVLYIQNTGTVTQNVQGWLAGTYVVSFRAARRANAGGMNDFRVLVDGQHVGTFLPASTAYDALMTAAFTVTSGAHTIRFEGMNSGGGWNVLLNTAITDNTVFIDDIRVVPVPAEHRDPGFTTWFFYDRLGRPTATVDALGADWAVNAIPDALPASVTTNVSRTTYDSRGRVVATTDVLGRTTDYVLDNLNRTLTETAPAPSAGQPRPVTSYSYDAVGNRLTVTDPLLNVTGYVYDAGNRRTKVIDALTRETVTAYDLLGNTQSVTDASGNITQYAYDRLDRLVTETDPLGSSASYAYDLVGRAIRNTDRLGRGTQFVYDAADRLVEERWQQSAAGSVFHTIKKYFDAAGQLIGVTETDTVNSAATTAWQYSYDALGNLIKSRMAPGELRQQPAFTGTVVPPGSLAASDSTIDWDSDGVAERYDGYGITLAVGDQILVTVSSAAFDPVVMLQKPNAGLSTASFDDHSGGGTTARLLITADIAGTWLIAVTARDANATGSYDLQIVQDTNAIVSDALVEYDFVYDKAGNLLQANEDQAAVATIPGLGQAAIGLGVGTTVTVDPLNRATRYRHVTLATGAVTKRVDYAYRGDGSVALVTRFAGAGTNPIGTTTNTYDLMGRLTQIVHAPTGSPAITYGYTFDGASRMASMTTPEGTNAYTLDKTDQLLSATQTTEAYVYDATGNRTSSGTLTGLGNRLLFDGVYRYAYDAEGNRTAKFKDTNPGGVLSVGDTDITAYGYDQRNRLVSISHVNAWSASQAAALASFTTAGSTLPGSDLELRYTYDFADRRIRMSIDADGTAGASLEGVSFAAYAAGNQTLKITRPNDVLVFDGSGNVIGFQGKVVQRFLKGTGEDEVLAVDKLAWSGTTPTTSIFWTLGDHQDSVRDVVSGNAPTLGQVVEHRQFDSFGNVIRRTTGPQAGAPTTAGVGIEFGYAGTPFETRSGLSDNRARWYEPSTGRFVNEDPSGFSGGDANLFRYVGNSPLDRVDPSGLKAAWATMASPAGYSSYDWSGLSKATEVRYPGPSEALVGSPQSSGFTQTAGGTLSLGGSSSKRPIPISGGVGSLYAIALASNQSSSSYISPLGGAVTGRSWWADYALAMGEQVTRGIAGLIPNAANAVVSIATGEASRALGERGHQLTVANNGGDFTWANFTYHAAGTLVGTHSIAEGWESVDLGTHQSLTPLEANVRFYGGIGQTAGVFAGVAQAARYTFGPGTFTNLSGSGILSRAPSKGLSAADSWGKPGTLAKHFSDHGADFGAASAENYARQASQFLQKSQPGGLPTKVGPDGVIRVYDAATNTFGSFNPNGTTKTFYRPNPVVHEYPTNLDYWNSQPGGAPWTP